MHACGHDAHTAMLAVAAVALAREGGPKRGAVKFFFQPDEEGSGGARIIMDQGGMDRPRVDAVFGLHVNPRYPAGTVAIKEGPLMAAVDRFTLEVIGEGGHGAYPQEGRDAVVIAAQVVMALQTVVSRRVDPVEPVVLTVGTVRGGERFNILARSVILTGTVRTLSTRWRRELPRLIAETASHTARAGGGRVRLRYETLSGPVVNDPAMTDFARRVAVRTLGPRAVVDAGRPSMGGEDFSEYLRRAPGCFIYLGTGASAATRRPWHHASFTLHEPSLLTGVRLLRALAKEGTEALK
jgi:amidohydrolase